MEDFLFQADFLLRLCTVHWVFSLCTRWSHPIPLVLIGSGNKFPFIEVWITIEWKSCSVAKSCTTICDPMDGSTLGFPVFHCLQEFAQTQVCWVGDAIQPPHPLLPPSSALSLFPASRSFSFSRLFASGGHSVGASASASVLPMSIQSWFPLGLTGLISLLSKELSSLLQHHSLIKHQFFGAQPSLRSNSYIHTWLSEKP